MSLPKIRLEPCDRIAPNLWWLDAAQERHLVNVLRHYDGARVEGLLSGRGGEGEGKKFLMLLERAEDGYRLRVLDGLEEKRDALSITLVLGLLKSDQFEDVLRASAELGVQRLVPVVCERSIPRIKDAEMPKKLGRWKKILGESSKISGSADPPHIDTPLKFAEIKWYALPERRYAAMLARDTRPLLQADAEAGEVVLAVGPEGDWSESEMRTLLEEKFVPIALGRRILRASTAAIACCAWFRLSETICAN